MDFCFAFMGRMVECHSIVTLPYVRTSSADPIEPAVPIRSHRKHILVPSHKPNP